MEEFLCGLCEDKDAFSKKFCDSSIVKCDWIHIWLSIMSRRRESPHSRFPSKGNMSFQDSSALISCFIVCLQRRFVQNWQNNSNIQMQQTDFSHSLLLFVTTKNINNSCCVGIKVWLIRSRVPVYYHYQMFVFCVTGQTIKNNDSDKRIEELSCLMEVVLWSSKDFRTSLNLMGASFTSTFLENVIKTISFLLVILWEKRRVSHNWR